MVETNFFTLFNFHAIIMILQLTSLFQSPSCKILLFSLSVVSECLQPHGLSHSAVFDSLWPHGLQHTRLPSPWPTPCACSNSCSLTQCFHPTIWSFVVPFSSCLQSFPASGYFLMSQLFPSGSQNIGASASASVLPMNIQDWFSLGMTGLISLQSMGLSSLLQHHSWKASILWFSAFSHLYMTNGKTIPLTVWTLVGKLLSLLFNVQSRCEIDLLPRSKCLLISWLQSPSAVILETQKIKSVTFSTVSPSIYLEVMGLDAMIFIFWMLNF